MKTGLSLLALAVASSAWADTIKLDTLRIESAPVQATLGNIIVGEDAVERHSATTLKDMFKSTATVTSSAGSAVNNKVVVQGIEESNMTVSIDGAIQNKGGWHHSGNVLLDPALLKRVEISGLAPADAGSGAVAGFIKYELKDAADLLAQGQTFGSLVSFASDSNAGGARANVAVYGDAGIGYLVSFTRQDSDNYESSTGAEQLNTAVDLTDLVAKFNAELAAGTLSVTLNSTRDNAERELTEAPGFAPGVLFARTDAGYTTAGVERVEQKRASQTVKFESNSTGVFSPVVQFSNSVQEPNARDTAAEMTNQNLVVSNEFAVDFGTVNLGVDWTQSEGKQTKGVTQWNGGLRKKENLDSKGVFAQFRGDLTDATSVSAGLRFDTQDFEGVDGTKLNDSGVSSNVQLTQQLNEMFALTGGFASTWGGFEIGEAALYSSFPGMGGALQTTYGTGANQMKATTSETQRLGLVFAQNEITAQVSLFNTEIDDIAAQTYDRSQSDDLTSKGYSIDVSKEMENGTLTFGFADIDVEVNDLDAGSNAYYQGRSIGQVFNSGYIHSVTSELSAQLNLHGARDLDITYDNRGTPTAAKLEGYEAVDLGLRFAPVSVEGLSFSFDVINLTDEDYVLRGATQDVGANSISEPGRTVAAGIRYQF